MHNLGVVFGFELRELMHKKPYIISTIIIGAVILFLAVSPVLLRSLFTDDTNTQDSLEGGVFYEDTALAGILPFDGGTYDSEDALRQAVKDGDETIGYVIEDATHIKTIYNNTEFNILELKLNDKNKNISINFLDSNKKNIGTFKYNKSSNGFNFNLLFNQDNKAINLVFSSKFINYNKDGYSNEMVISFKRTDNLINVLSGDIKISNKISKKVKINEDVSTAVLSSSLTEEQINNKTNQFINIKERYKR